MAHGAQPELAGIGLGDVLLQAVEVIRHGRLAGRSQADGPDRGGRTSEPLAERGALVEQAGAYLFEDGWLHDVPPLRPSGGPAAGSG